RTRGSREATGTMPCEIATLLRRVVRRQSKKAGGGGGQQSDAMLWSGRCGPRGLGEHRIPPPCPRVVARGPRRPRSPQGPPHARGGRQQKGRASMPGLEKIPLRSNARRQVSVLMSI